MANRKGVPYYVSVLIFKLESKAVGESLSVAENHAAGSSSEAANALLLWLA